MSNNNKVFIGKELLKNRFFSVIVDYWLFHFIWLSILTMILIYVVFQLCGLIGVTIGAIIVVFVFLFHLFFLSKNYIYELSIINNYLCIRYLEYNISKEKIIPLNDNVKMEWALGGRGYAIRGLIISAKTNKSFCERIFVQPFICGWTNKKILSNVNYFIFDNNIQTNLKMVDFFDN